MRFTLRQGVRFHDGTEFDAAAVKFNVERLMDRDRTPTNRRLRDLPSGAELVDAQTVVVRTKAEFSQILNSFAHGSGSMVSPASVARHGEKGVAQIPVGAGPFMLEAFVPGQEVSLKAFDGHWGGRPATDRLVFKFIAEPATRIAALRTGAVDIVDSVPVQLVAGLKREAGIDVIARPGLRPLGLVINLASAPPDAMAVDMDYSGIGTVVLQNDHIYGDLAAYFAEAARTWPGRFIGLAQVDEPFSYRDDQLAKLEGEVSRLGMRGLYFTMTAFFRNGYAHFPDEPLFDPLWKLVARLGLPVFWVHSAKSPAGTYLDEMKRLARIVERHPAIRHVLVHGVPTSIYCDDADRLAIPAEICSLLEGGRVLSEVLYPIAWGGKMAYPYRRAQGHVRQLYDRFGPAPFCWGSDMPNVGRYCTYRQSFSYVWDECDFISKADRRKIFRENALGLFA